MNIIVLELGFPGLNPKITSSWQFSLGKFTVSFKTLCDAFLSQFLTVIMSSLKLNMKEIHLCHDSRVWRDLHQHVIGPIWMCHSTVQEQKGNETTQPGNIEKWKSEGLVGAGA